MTGGDGGSYWERPEQVERFAGRDPDHRLRGLVGGYGEPRTVRVLDLGCAAGRNTVLLAEMGFDFFAVDGSAAMIRHTRGRVAAIVGEEVAAERVRRGEMDDLGDLADGSFQLVVALGIYHQASSLEQWHSAVAETRRVLAMGGRVLVSVFDPRSQPLGEPLQPVGGKPNVYRGFRAGPICLHSADELDDGMARHGLVPATPTETVRAETDRGFRFTVDGLYVPAGEIGDGKTGDRN